MACSYLLVSNAVRPASRLIGRLGGGGFTSDSHRFHFDFTTSASLKTFSKHQENESQRDHRHRGTSVTKEASEMLKSFEKQRKAY